MTAPIDTVLGLVRAHAAVVKRFDARLGALHGASLADFTMLWHLSQAPDGRMRRVDLAARLGLSASGVTRGLAPLERIGLVTREPGERDRRVVQAALTEVGRERLADMSVTAEQVAAEIFASPSWAPQDLEHLTTSLAHLAGGEIATPPYTDQDPRE